MERIESLRWIRAILVQIHIRTKERITDIITRIPIRYFKARANCLEVSDERLQLVPGMTISTIDSNAKSPFLDPDHNFREFQVWQTSQKVIAVDFVGFPERVEFLKFSRFRTERILGGTVILYSVPIKNIFDLDFPASGGGRPQRRVPRCSGSLPPSRRIMASSCPE